MKLDQMRVVVAGAGTGGCAVALLLSRAGAEVTLFERVAEPRAVGAGIGLAENGWAVLQALGLEPRLEGAARPVAGARIVDAAGRTIFDPGPEAPKLRMIRRSDLQNALLDAVAAEPGIDARFGHEVLAAEADGRVTARSGADDGLGEEVVEPAADLVVGADGVHSRVRDGGDFGARVDREGIAYVRGLAAGATALGEEAWTAAGLFGSFAVEGATYWYASAGTRAVANAVERRDLPAFRAAWLDALPRAAPVLSAIASWDELVVNRVVRIACRRWVAGRRVLLGDAAHAMAPNLGQGANSALVDAAVLRDELRRAPELAAALRAYEARRLPAVTRVANVAHRLGALAEWTSAPARALRDRLLMPLAGRLGDRTQQAELVLQEPPLELRKIASS